MYLEIVHKLEQEFCPEQTKKSIPPLPEKNRESEIRSADTG